MKSDLQLIKSILYFIASLLVFILGVFTYGVILNTKEMTIEEAMEEAGIEELENISIVIDRKNYKLILYADSVEIKKYKVSFGRNNSVNKKSKNDLITPLGTYKICSIDSKTDLYKKFNLNYPNEKDAAEAFKNNYLSYDEYLNILQALQNGECPPNNTRLGADISIHGIGKYDIIFRNLPFVFNWTNGSIALSNQSIDELSKILEIGTKIVIKN